MFHSNGSEEPAAIAMKRAKRERSNASYDSEDTISANDEVIHLLIHFNSSLNLHFVFSVKHS